jgi:hypothetical protein
MKPVAGAMRSGRPSDPAPLAEDRGSFGGLQKGNELLRRRIGLPAPGQRYARITVNAVFGLDFGGLSR